MASARKRTGRASLSNRSYCRGALVILFLPASRTLPLPSPLVHTMVGGHYETGSPTPIEEAVSGTCAVCGDRTGGRLQRYLLGMALELCAFYAGLSHFLRRGEKRKAADWKEKGYCSFPVRFPYASSLAVYGRFRPACFVTSSPPPPP